VSDEAAHLIQTSLDLTAAGLLPSSRDCFSLHSHVVPYFQ